MADKQDFLIQKITLVRNKYELDLSFLKEALYVETLDLSGPRFMLVMDDPWRLLRDDNAVAEKDVLEVSLADVVTIDKLDKTIRFVIQTMPIEGKVITFNCIQETVYLLKQPAKEAMLFVDKPLSAILSKLAPGSKLDSASFPTLNSYHLLPGMRPTKLLRQWAHENGAVLFWQRGKFVARKLKELLKATPKFTYHSNDPKQERIIIAHKKLNSTSTIRDKAVRHYVGWDMVKGRVESSVYPTAPIEIASVTAQGSLNALTDIPKPTLDLTMAGDGALMPGLALKLVWNAERVDAPIDESLPTRNVTGTVCHFYSAQKYYCRVIGVLP